MEKFIIALNKTDKTELDKNNFKFVIKEIMDNRVVYIYENDKELVVKLKDKNKFLFSSLLFV